RWMADLNHIIVMEDLRYIRNRIQVAKKQPQIQHSWAFGQLGSFIEYKTAERGIAVIYIDPRHTSQRCPRCGFVARDNRKGHVFRCASFGFVGHADVVTATNIRQVFLDTLADGPPSVGPEAASSCKPPALAVG
ncbi:MAG: zinc ribbon domain-containing protein, partial [Dictyoglomaceae bacterium]